jgi:hypothetical protein
LSDSELDETEKQSDRGSKFPNWILFSICATSIYLSPLGFTGILTVFQFLYESYDLNSALIIPIQIVLALVGLVTFAILLKRKSYGFAILLVLWAFFDIGMLQIFGVLIQYTDPGL